MWYFYVIWRSRKKVKMRNEREHDIGISLNENALE